MWTKGPPATKGLGHGRIGTDAPAQPLGEPLGHSPSRNCTEEFAHLLFQPTQLGGGYNLIGADGFATSFAHQPSPAEHQAGAQAVAASNIADPHAGLHRLADDGQPDRLRTPSTSDALITSTVC